MVLFAVGRSLGKYVRRGLQKSGIVRGEHYPDLILACFLVRFSYYFHNAQLFDCIFPVGDADLNTQYFVPFTSTP